MIRNQVTILALALALGAAAAGAQQGTTNPQTPHAGASANARQHGGRKGARGARRAGHKAKALRHAAMRGVDLTDAQKSQMKTLRGKYKGEAKPIADRMRPALQEARSARQKGDTAAARAALARTTQDRAAMKALRDRQRTEMLAVLTPEQRAKVDANTKAMKAKHEKRNEKRNEKRAKKA